MIVIGLFLTFTRMGKAMRAVRDSGELASVSGINSDSIILFTWVSSSMLAGLAGIFQAIINDVRYNMGFLILLLIFLKTYIRSTVIIRIQSKWNNLQMFRTI